MKNFHKHPYRGVFRKAARILGITGDNAAIIASNKYRRGNGDVVMVVNKLVAKIERQHEQRMAQLEQSVEREAV